MTILLQTTRHVARSNVKPKAKHSPVCIQGCKELFTTKFSYTGNTLFHGTFFGTTVRSICLLAKVSKTYGPEKSWPRNQILP